MNSVHWVHFPTIGFLDRRERLTCRWAAVGPWAISAADTARRRRGGNKLGAGRLPQPTESAGGRVRVWVRVRVRVRVLETDRETKRGRESSGPVVGAGI